MNDRFDKAIQKGVTTEMEILTKRIMSDLAVMVVEAHNHIQTLGIFPKFKSKLKGSIAKSDDLRRLKAEIETAVDSNDPNLLKYFKVVLFQDSKNRRLVGLEFKLRENIF